MAQLQQTVSVFYSYAHEDEQLREHLNKHLATLERLQAIVGWHEADLLREQGRKF